MSFHSITPLLLINGSILQKGQEAVVQWDRCFTKVAEQNNLTAYGTIIVLGIVQTAWPTLSLEWHSE